MKIGFSRCLLSLVLLFSLVFASQNVAAQEDLRGPTLLDIRADAAVVEVYDAPGEAPSFQYDASRYTVLSEKRGETLTISIEPRWKYLHGADTVKVFLPIDDYTAIRAEANASGLSLPPFHADFEAVVNASALTCYFPEDFAYDLRIEANASAVDAYLHKSLQDFTLEVQNTVSAVSLPQGIRDGGKNGGGAHLFDIQAIASSVDVSWYDDATPIPAEASPETSAPEQGKAPAAGPEAAPVLSFDISIPALAANEEVYLGSFTMPSGCDVAYTLAAKGGKGIAVGMTRREDTSLLNSPTRYLMAQTQDDAIRMTFYADDIASMEGRTLYVWVSSLGDAFTDITGTVEIKPGVPGRTNFPSVDL